MRGLRWHISPGAALALALLYFYDSGGTAAALVPAVLVHELGHLLALLACGGRLQGVSLELFGLEMTYSGVLFRRQRLLALAAGPLAGAAYGAACLALGGAGLRLSGAVSLALSAYNALPILPLDGGRVLSELLEGTPERAARISAAAACCFLLVTLVMLRTLHTPVPAAAALWLVYLNFRRQGQP